MIFHIFYLQLARPRPGHVVPTKHDAPLSDKRARCS
jgi:hypothetical protein